VRRILYSESLYLVSILPLLVSIACGQTSNDKDSTGQFRPVDHAWLNHPLKTPNGLVWGFAPQKDPNSPHILLVNHADAIAHCASINARLPTRDEYLQLFADLENQPSSANYVPYDYVNVTHNHYWSSTIASNSSIFVFNFNKETDRWERDAKVRYGVHCVASN
jgi:hypothetical protein